MSVMHPFRKLESESIFIIREAFEGCKNLALLWSIGKDSTVLLWLCKKAFFGTLPFPIIHIDTGFKIPEMIQYRSEMVKKWNLTLIVGKNEDALNNKDTYPDGKLSCVQCCQKLKSEPLKGVIQGTYPRYYLNTQTGIFEKKEQGEPFDGIIVGIRADEEGSRSKERVFSPRGFTSSWNIEDQPPEFWNLYNTEKQPQTHFRIHPLMNWTELDIWKYIHYENIPLIDLYLSRNQKRYRSLGCAPCTHPISSEAKTLEEIIFELEKGTLAKVPERAGRKQDTEDRATLETLRREGYM